MIELGELGLGGVDQRGDPLLRVLRVGGHPSDHVGRGIVDLRHDQHTRQHQSEQDHSEKRQHRPGTLEPGPGGEQPHDGFEQKRQHRRHGEWDEHRLEKSHRLPEKVNQCDRHHPRPDDS